MLVSIVAFAGLTACGDDGLEPDTYAVTAVDYGFEGLPDKAAVGSTLTMTNASSMEVHELVAIRLPDDETRSGSELMALPMNELMAFAGKERIDIRKIMILGGSLIGREFAKRVQSEYKVKIIDYDKEKCYELADELVEAMVIHGDGSNVELLEEEGIEEMDAFIAVTGDSEDNIISCLVAKNHGVKRTIALVENIDYISLSQNIGIDTLINKKMITVNNIFRYVREGTVASLTSLHGVDSEILEFIVHHNCHVAETPIKKLKFPRDAIIAGVIREEEGFIANGNTMIESGDRVVVFTLPSAVHKVEKFFK